MLDSYILFELALMCFIDLLVMQELSYFLLGRILVDYVISKAFALFAAYYYGNKLIVRVVNPNVWTTINFSFSSSVLDSF